MTGSAGDAAALTDEFWNAAADGRLVRPVCNSCGRSFFTPRVACPYCLATDWAYRDSVGAGTIVSHTTVHRGPDTSWDVPYVLGAVNVDEGWTMLTRLLVDPPGDDLGESLIGRRVGVQFVGAHPPDTRRLPAFGLSEKPATIVDPDIASNKETQS